MEKAIAFIAVFCTLTVHLSGCGFTALSMKKSNAKPSFKVTSSNFSDGGELPAPYSCAGKPFATGYSPALEWTKGPRGTQSYAIVLFDKTLVDAGNANYGFHWAMWNIPKNQLALPEGIPGVLPDSTDDIVELPNILGAAQHSQARGVKQFFGPCPSWKTYCTQGEAPLSTDTYNFIIYAMAEERITVPSYNPEINPNYVDTLNSLFNSKSLDHAVISATSNAAPISLPFPCPE